MNELRAPVLDIKQPEKHRAYHGYDYKIAMMLGQRETDDSRNQSNRPASDGHRDGVERANPLLINLEQRPKLSRRWLRSGRARLARRRCYTTLIHAPVVCAVRAIERLIHLQSA